MHRHICASCLKQGCVLDHAESDCTVKKHSKKLLKDCPFSYKMGSSVVASKGPNVVSENTECEHKKKCVDVKIVNNTDVGGINVHTNDKAKHSARFIYNNKCKAGDVESLLVRPLAYSFMIYRSALTDVSKCSYANIVKSKNRNPLSVKTKSAEVVHNKNIPSGSV